MSRGLTHSGGSCFFLSHSQKNSFSRGNKENSREMNFQRWMTLVLLLGGCWFDMAFPVHQGNPINDFDFLIGIGVQKSGTTTLFSALNKISWTIGVRQKELHAFDVQCLTLDEYIHYGWNDVSNSPFLHMRPLLFEFTPRYLLYDPTPTKNYLFFPAEFTDGFHPTPSSMFHFSASLPHPNASGPSLHTTNLSRSSSW